MAVKLEIGRFKFGISDKKSEKNYTPTPVETPISLDAGSMGLDITLQNALALWKNPQSAIIWSHSNIPEVFAPVSWVIEASARIPWVHERLVAGDKWESVKNSEALRLLANPNQHQTNQNYITSTLLNTILTGELFINPFRGIGSRQPDSLYVFQSDSITPKYTDATNGDFRAVHIKEYTSNFITIQPEDMVYRKQSNILEDPTKRGVSVLTSLANTTKSLQATSEASIVLKESRGAMGLLSATDANAGVLPEDMDKATNALNTKGGITGNKKPIIGVNKPITYQQISMDVQALGLTESQLVDLRNVCGVLKIASELVGDKRASTYNNLKIIKSSLLTDAAIPLIQFVVEAHNDVFKFDTTKERLRADYSGEEALQGDRKINTDISLAYYNAGLIEGDEALEDDGRAASGKGLKPVEVKETNTQT